MGLAFGPLVRLVLDLPDGSKKVATACRRGHIQGRSRYRKCTFAVLAFWDRPDDRPPCRE
jgi:hypothetical protein